MGVFRKAKPTEIELGPKLFKALVAVMSDPTGNTKHKSIAYAGRNVKQEIAIVGESNFQDEISKFKKGWSYGFLVPEQDNKFDKNAVALYLVDGSYEIHKVGYLPKELAAKVSKSIANLLVNEGQIIPIISKVEGGTKDKPELGVFASARTEAINF
jgi:hypothetical protein